MTARPARNSATASVFCPVGSVPSVDGPLEFIPIDVTLGSTAEEELYQEETVQEEEPAQEEPSSEEEASPEGSPAPSSDPSGSPTPESSPTP